ncbi:hypothetical protein M408DRAFT_79332 [Serendipita vermifera MAFF 305830]|uniref:glutathione transferase n=1 Tax=Serendipita vermifera MAFF 305830 TaxID=933852 RepID=A0A0C3AQ96_SERVB|nr:hypothetical protein M408DRAFT_79332 [Serendipita vermifera MAFF 305830]
MVLKLYTTEIAGNGRRVAAILHELRIPYELVQPGSFADLKTEAWKDYRPFGQMPYINDDGFVLYESRAIAKYLATKYASSASPLLPAKDDLNATALYDQAVSVEMSDFEPYAGGLFREKVFKKWQGMEPESLFVTSYETILKGKMDGFEKILSKQKYMAGDKLTIVDFFYLPFGSALEPAGYDYFVNESKYPNVARWWKEMTTKESWVKVKDGVPPSL